MTREPNVSNPVERGATVVITHRVRDGQQAAYEDWLNEIRPVCSTFPGHIDLQVVRPLPGLTATYTFILRFDTREHVENWMGSEARKRLVEKVRPILAGNDDFFIRSGLDFWFTPEGAQARVPVRWKQFLVTWSAIYPLVLLVPMAVAPLLRRMGLPQEHYIDTLWATGLVVALMVYVVMPRYTRLVQHWLFD